MPNARKIIDNGKITGRRSAKPSAAVTADVVRRESVSLDDLVAKGADFYTDFDHAVVAAETDSTSYFFTDKAIFKKLAALGIEPEEVETIYAPLIAP